ncbi:hypothetical protein Scep_012247 [Stephania cephalantha]|uniref:Uncharacterized protein n=1 Tax=Stephania cephalantha TaxID=152367 RepID=A0AAP0JER4_9MAGN
MAPTFPPKLCFLITVHQISRFLCAWIKAPPPPPPQIPKSHKFGLGLCSSIVSFVSALRSSRLSVSLSAPERHTEATRATPDQPVDDEAVYLNVAGECPKGRVYGLGSLGRKKRRYARSWC